MKTIDNPISLSQIQCLNNNSITEVCYGPDAEASGEVLNDLTDNEAAGPSAENEDDEFERLLQEFIDSQLEEDDDVAEEKTEHLRGVMEALNHLTGLSEVKMKVERYESIVRFNKMRQDAGLPVNSLPLHAMFLGSPGTGKTTVAKLMGRMLRDAGVLSRGHVVVKERASLMGIHYGEEEANTLKALEEARGGILFIDEAYQLYQPNDPKDPGKFVIESLMTALADDDNRDWMLILAGYPAEMKRMFDMNPGLKSRIPESNIYTFSDFSETELMEIAEHYLDKEHYTLSVEAREALNNRLSADYARRDKSFGNARHVVSMIQTEILPAMAMRVTCAEKITPEMLSEIYPDDIPASQPLCVNRQKLGFH